METRIMPTIEETHILLKAQKELMDYGVTSIRCPRCGKLLECRINSSGSAVYCYDKNCIIVTVRGI